MAVTVFIKRKINKNYKKKVGCFFIQLENLASFFPGYISGEFLTSTENPDESLVISKWRSINHWCRYVESNDRIEIQNMIDLMLDESTKISYYQHS